MENIQEMRCKCTGCLTGYIVQLHSTINQLQTDNTILKESLKQYEMPKEIPSGSHSALSKI